MSKLSDKIAKLHKVCQQKRDDRGSSIVIVIIAMAMIGILASTLLWMSYMNYMIKIADIRNKESFYSAEEVVEQIMAGLQNTSSEAVGTAYQEVMTNWDSLETEEGRYNIFATTYFDVLIERLEDPVKGTGYYDRDKLKDYVDADIFNETSDTVGVDVDAWENGNAVGETQAEPKMEMVNDNSLILHNIYVSYTADDGRVSIVQTDICMDVPKLIFSQEGSIDKLYDYVLIGNEGIEVTGGSGTINAEGSIYAGTDANNKGGILVNAASTLAVDEGKKVISKGDITVEGPKAGFVVRDVLNERNSVYARNLNLNSGTISLDSNTYVANDLSLNGSSSKVTLSQTYYGYGISTFNGLVGEPDIDSANSSAIIINGRNSTVDMTGVKKLLIAGRAYIGQSVTRAEADLKQQQIEAGLIAPLQPVMMGESIAVKGNQIAYLVPAECIGILEGEIVGGQNPLSGDKEADMVTCQNEYGSAFKEVDFFKPVYKLGNKSLSDFGVVDSQHIRKVHVPYNGSTLVYYYLVMDKANAERYFVQYYDFSANKETIDSYFNQYASGGILLGDFNAPGNQYTILGNSLVSSAIADSGVTLLTGLDQSSLSPEEDNTEDEGDKEDTEQEETAKEDGDYQEIRENADEVVNYRDEADVMMLSAEIAGTYQALTTNLTEDASTIGVDQNVFNSIIKEDELEEYLNNYGANTVTYTTDAGLKAVVTKRSETKLSEMGDSSKVRLIIALGDVIIDRNFSGLVIAKGKITIDGSVPNGAASVKWNKMELYKVLSGTSSLPADTITPLDIFVDGQGSMVNGAEEAEVDDAGNLEIDYGEIVRYMNWIKK